MVPDPPDRRAPGRDLELPRLRARLLLAHVATAGLVAFVALWRLATADAAADEYAYRTCGIRYIEQGRMLCNTAHPPLAKELLGVGIALGGNSIETARLVAASAALATALCLYLFVRDVAGAPWGLVAAALWGLLPQAGVENGVSLEAIRIDRFALLDPFVACFFALALFAAWKWMSDGRPWWSALTGAACAAAACSKVPGLLAAPVLLGAPFAVRLRHRPRASLVEGAAAAGGAVLVVALVYVPFGLHGAYQQINDMVSFQSAHASRGTSSVFGRHFYRRAPWWSGLGYAVLGLGWPAAIALAASCLGVLVGVRRNGVARAAALGIGASACVWGFLAFLTHLSLPYYWVDWEAGVVAAAALGLSALFGSRKALVAGVVVTVPLVVASIVTIVSVATVTVGPYQEAARAIACRTCQVLYVADGTVLGDYLDIYDTWQARSAPAGDLLSSKTGNLVVPEPGHRPSAPEPTFVVIDGASELAAHLLVRDVVAFERHFSAVGYVRVHVPGRLLVWRLRSYHVTGRRSSG